MNELIQSIDGRISTAMRVNVNPLKTFHYHRWHNVRQWRLVLRNRMDQ